DGATRTNLELVRTLSGEARGSLVAAIDRTVTAPGARLLAQRLAAPLTDPDAIARRLDAVEALLGDPAIRQHPRAALNTAPDLARASVRLVLGRGGARDLAAIRDGLEAAMRLAEKIEAPALAPESELAAAARALREPDPALAAELAGALGDELPFLKRDGG